MTPKCIGFKKQAYIISSFLQIQQVCPLVPGFREAVFKVFAGVEVILGLQSGRMVWKLTEVTLPALRFLLAIDQTPGFLASWASP